jgi:hypothetical protein
MQAFDPESIKPCYLFAQKYGYRGPRIPSAMHQGRRVRGVGRQVYYRPVAETFAEFKYQHLKFVLGKKWWMHEARQPPDQRHAIMQCAFEYHEVAKRHVPEGHQAGQVFSAPPTNAVFELLQLSDDVLRLTASEAGMPDGVLDRLRKRESFQGARFELFVAGLLVRCGFKIEWLDRELKGGEFEARDPQSGESFCVEAKSRHRPGTIHQPGERPAEETLEADLDNLFKSALKQCRPTTANTIFIDANLPMTEDPEVGWRYWKTVEEFMERIPKRIDREKSYNAFFVNIIANGWHWRPTEAVENPPAAHAFLSPRNHLPSNPNTLIRLIAATAYPPRLPESIYE